MWLNGKYTEPYGLHSTQNRKTISYPITIVQGWVYMYVYKVADKRGQIPTWGSSVCFFGEARDTMYLTIMQSSMIIWCDMGSDDIRDTTCSANSRVSSLMSQSNGRRHANPPCWITAYQLWKRGRHHGVMAHVRYSWIWGAPAEVNRSVEQSISRMPIQFAIRLSFGFSRFIML